MFRSLVTARSRGLRSFTGLLYAYCKPTYFTSRRHASSAGSVPMGALRALGHDESVAVEFQPHGSILAVKFTINSLVPIKEDTMRKAIEIARVKIPMHRLRVIDHKGVKYFTETENEVIDFEYMDELNNLANFHDIHDQMLGVFDVATGPLWRAKCVSRRRDTGSSLTHPFCYDIFMSWHHSIIDGRSSIFRFQHLLMILDRIIDGRKHDGATDMTILPALDDLLPGRAYRWSEVEPYVKKMITTESCAYIKHFPAQGASLQRTNCMFFDPIDENQVTELRRRAKIEGATLHGAFTAAANIAVFKAIKNGKHYNDKAIMLKVQHAVDMRHYFGPEYKQADGFYVGSVVTETTIAQDHVQHFWQLANEITKHLKINSSPEKIIQKTLTTDKLFRAQQLLSKARQIPYYPYDYAVSNMGDVTPLFTKGKYNNFYVEGATTWSNLRFFSVPYYYDVYTLRGKMCISIQWPSDCVTEEQVKQIGESTIDILKLGVEK